MVFHRDLRLGLMMIVRADIIEICTEAMDRLDADDVQSAFRDAENSNGAAVMWQTNASLFKRTRFSLRPLFLLIARRAPPPASAIVSNARCYRSYFGCRRIFPHWSHLLTEVNLR